MHSPAASIAATRRFKLGWSPSATTSMSTSAAERSHALRPSYIGPVISATRSVTSLGSAFVEGDLYDRRDVVDIVVGDGGRELADRVRVHQEIGDRAAL